MDTPIAASELALAKEAAARAGVTRLADVTGLDCLGVPVFQAVRPASVALSVHQGKAFTRAGAMLGALMEAVESHRAEGVVFDGILAAYDDLPNDERSGALDDFAVVRGDGVDPSKQMRWVRTRRIADDTVLWAPFDFVSLDLSREGEPGIERISTGQAARFGLEQAILVGLLEVLERDACAVWRQAPLGHRAARAIAPRSVGYPWFCELHTILGGAGITLALYALESVVGAPVIGAELLEPAAFPCARVLAGGYCCGLTAEDALRGAMLEALQSRVTIIAGARDDVLYDGQPQSVILGSGCPLPPFIAARQWSVVERGAEPFEGLSGRDLTRILTRCGYPDSAFVALSGADDPVVVVKVIVPGLADEERIRRPPVAVQ